MGLWYLPEYRWTREQWLWYLPEYMWTRERWLWYTLEHTVGGPVNGAAEFTRVYVDS